MKSKRRLPQLTCFGCQIMGMVLSAVPYFILCMVFWVFIRLAWRCFTYPLEQRHILRQQKEEEDKKKNK